jgi:fucose 4-O-acetylase-like acetyltransferase
MKLDSLSSERLTILRFPLIVGVVFIHAYGTGTDVENTTTGEVLLGYVSQLIQDLVSQGLAGIAVPLFFVMSGYLFFFGFEWSLNSYTNKLRRRAGSLLIPYLFWNSLTLSLLALAQWLSAGRVHLSGSHVPVASYGWYDCLNSLLGITRSPVSYQFWFIRDLMLMVLAVPILQLILRTAPLMFLCAIALLWLLGVWPVYAPSCEACFFFYAGAYVAFTKHSLFCVDRYAKGVLSVYAVMLVLDMLTRDAGLHGYVHRLGILFGVTSALCASRYIVRHEKLRVFLAWASGCSFFVFAVHEPMLTILRHVSYKLLSPVSSLTVLVLYFAVPTLVICVSIMAHVLLKKIAPRFLRVVLGGR